MGTHHSREKGSEVNDKQQEQGREEKERGKDLSGKSDEGVGKEKEKENGNDRLKGLEDNNKKGGKESLGMAEERTLPPSIASQVTFIKPENVKSWREGNRVGRSAQVLKGEMKGGGGGGTIPVAVKAYQYGKLTDVVWETFLCEVTALMMLVDHPNIAQCYGIWLSPRMTMVMEWVGDDLYHTLLNPSINLSPHRPRIVSGMASACQLMHSLSLLHRDIKPNNLLLTSSFEAKLCDFGLTISLESSPDLAGDKKGTSGWAAPEIMGAFPYSFPADVFSFGVCVWSLFSPGTPNPFCGMTSSVYFAAIQQGKRPPFTPKGDKGEEFFVDLWERCWTFLPEKRPTFSEIKEEIVAQFPDP